MPKNYLGGTTVSENGDVDIGSMPKVLIALCGLFLALTWIAVSLRVYVRAWVLRCFGLDDWFMLVALVLNTGACVVMIWISNFEMYGIAQELFLDVKLINWVLAYFELYITSMMLLKLSLAVFFLRIVVKAWQRWVIWISVGIYQAFSIAYLLIALLQCGNPEHFIIMVGAGKCMSFPKIVEPLGYAHATMNAVTDWVFAILPIFVLQTAQLTSHAKIPIILLIVLAVLGSISSCIRIPYIKDLDPKPDFFIKAVTIAIWSIVEPGLGITVASLATLRPIFRCLADRTRSALTPTWGYSSKGSKQRSETGPDKFPLSVVHDLPPSGPEMRGFQPIHSRDLERAHIAATSNHAREHSGVPDLSPYESRPHNNMHSGRYHPRPPRPISPSERASYERLERGGPPTKPSRPPGPLSPSQIGPPLRYDPHERNGSLTNATPYEPHSRNGSLTKKTSFEPYDRPGSRTKSPSFDMYDRTERRTKSPSFDPFDRGGAQSRTGMYGHHERNNSLTKAASVRSQESNRSLPQRQPSNASLLRSSGSVEHDLNRQASNSSGRREIDATKPAYQSRAWPANGGRVQVRYDPRALANNMF